MYATTAQVNYLLSLASKLAGRPLRWVSEAEPYLPISKTACRNITKRDASICIDFLKAKIG